MKHKKYASLASLEIFKENSDSLYATQESVKNKLDASEYIVDDSLSSTSTNPVQNKIIDAEFEAMSVAMNVLELSVDEKANASHTHEIADVTNLSSTLSEISDVVAQKSQVQVITTDTSEMLSTLKIHKLTQEEYDSLVENNNLEDNALYLTPDEEIDLSGYATKDDLDGKSNVGHNHDDLYYTETEIDSMLEGKSNADHNHDNFYDAKGAADSSLTLAKDYTDSIASGKADSDHTHDNLYSDINHNHDDAYDTKGAADNALTLAKDYADGLASNKADADHNHNSDYDTKGAASDVQSNLDDVVRDTLSPHIDNSDIHVTTIDKTNWNDAHAHSQSTHARADATKVTNSATNGNIIINETETSVYEHPTSGVTAGTYKSVTVNEYGHITGGSNPTTLAGYGITDAESKGAASDALASAKNYTDSVASGKSDTNHNHDNIYEVKGAAAAVKNELLNGAGGAYDTLKELGDLIDDNQDAIEALEVIASGKANATHTHTISEVSGLQSALDNKANSNHNHDDRYYTESEIDSKVSTINTSITTSLNTAKSYSDTNLNNAKTYTNNAVAQKTQVQLIIWEDED